MIVTHNVVDVSEAIAQGYPPVHEIERGSDQWLVSYDAIHMDQPLRWSQVLRGEVVSIPLVPYNLAPHLELALGFAMQLGMRVSLDVGQPVERLHLLLGHPAMPVYGNPTEPAQATAWKWWLGFGIVLQK